MKSQYILSFLIFFVFQYVRLSGDNPGLTYSFFAPKNVEVAADQVHWKTEDWSPCTEDCAGGEEEETWKQETSWYCCWSDVLLKSIVNFLFVKTSTSCTLEPRTWAYSSRPSAVAVQLKVEFRTLSLLCFSFPSFFSVFAFSHRKDLPRKLDYFFLPSSVHSILNAFTRSFPWSTGFQSRTVECVRKDDDSYVNDEMCLKSSSRPIGERPCNTKPCEPEYVKLHFIYMTAFFGFEDDQGCCQTKAFALSEDLFISKWEVLVSTK